MNALPAAANDSTGPQPAQRLVPARFVTIELASVLTGFTPGAIRTKMQRGVWVEGRQWVKRDGRVLIDMEGYHRWAATGSA